LTPVARPSRSARTARRATPVAAAAVLRALPAVLRALPVPRAVRVLFALPVLALLALLALHSSQALANTFDKAELVKAAVIEKIARFIDWPALGAGTFLLCAADDHPQLPVLRAYYEGTQIAERPVTVRPVRRFDGFTGCNVIVLGQKEFADLGRFRALAEKEHALLVAEGPDLARQGVHVAFYSDMNRLRLEVNKRGLEASGLKASFRLFEAARLVE